MHFFIYSNIQIYFLRFLNKDIIEQLIIILI